VLTSKGLHISAHLEIAIFSASNICISGFKRRDSIDYRNLSSESRSVDAETRRLEKLLTVARK
jgi:hypothetical protein